VNPDHERTTVRSMCIAIESRGQFARRGQPVGRYGRGLVGSEFGMADIMFDHLDLSLPAGSAA